VSGAPVPEGRLAEGAWYASRQAGLLLEDASRLFDAGRSGTAIALAMFAREEIGKARLLFGLAAETASGRKITVVDVRAECVDHEGKQEAAVFSISLSAPRDSAAAEIMKRVFSREDSDDAREVLEQLGRLVQAKRRRTPSDRHEARLRALYVDVRDDGAWSRPEDFDRQAALGHLCDSLNDYSIISSNIQQGRGAAPEVLRLILDWPDRPPLPPPSWPKTT